MNLQQLLQAIRDNSSRSQDLKQLLQQLKVSEETLKSQAAHLPDALAQIDPTAHSLGYLFLLYVVDRLHARGSACHDYR